MAAIINTPLYRDIMARNKHLSEDQKVKVIDAIDKAIEGYKGANVLGGLKYINLNKNLLDAFIWHHSPQGKPFWRSLYIGRADEIL